MDNFLKFIQLLLREGALAEYALGGYPWGLSLNEIYEGYPKEIIDLIIEHELNDLVNDDSSNKDNRNDDGTSKDDGKHAQDDDYDDDGSSDSNSNINLC